MDVNNPNQDPYNEPTGSKPTLDPVGFLVRSAFPQIYKYIDDRDKLNRKEMTRLERMAQDTERKQATINRQRTLAENALADSTAAALRKVTRDAEARVRAAEETAAKAFKERKEEYEDRYKRKEAELKKARADQLSRERDLTSDLNIKVEEVKQLKRQTREQISAIKDIPKHAKEAGMGKVSLSKKMQDELNRLLKQLADLNRQHSEALTNRENNIKDKENSRKANNEAERNLEKELSELNEKIEDLTSAMISSLEQTKIDSKKKVDDIHAKVAAADLLKNEAEIIAELGEGNRHTRKLSETLSKLFNLNAKEAKLEEEARHAHPAGRMENPTRMGGLLSTLGKSGFKAMLSEAMAVFAPEITVAAIAVAGAVALNAGVKGITKAILYGQNRLSGQDVNQADRSEKLRAAIAAGDTRKTQNLLEQEKGYQEWKDKGYPSPMGTPEEQHEEGGVKVAPSTRKRRGGGDAGIDPGAPDTPGGPSPILDSALASDRKKYAAELAANPNLRNKILAIAANEDGPTVDHGHANMAVLESGMNRASMTHSSLASTFRNVHEGGYYAGSPRWSALKDAKQKALLEDHLDKVLKGSNVSDYATDNASQGLARRDVANRRFIKRKNFGGNHETGAPGVETFFQPGPAYGGGSRGQASYNRWRAGLKADPDATPTPGIVAKAGKALSDAIVSPAEAGTINGKGKNLPHSKISFDTAKNALTPLPDYQFTGATNKTPDATPATAEKPGILSRIGGAISGAYTSGKKLLFGSHWDENAPHTKEEMDAEALRRSAMAVDRVGKLSGLSDGNPEQWAKIRKFMADGGAGMSKEDKEWCARTYQAAETQVGIHGKGNLAKNWSNTNDGEYRVVDTAKEGIKAGMLGISMPTQSDTAYGKAIGNSGHVRGFNGAVDRDGNPIGIGGNTRIDPNNPNGPHGIVAGTRNTSDPRPEVVVAPTGAALRKPLTDIDDKGIVGKAKDWIGHEYQEAKDWWNGPSATPVDQNPSTGADLNAASTAQKASEASKPASPATTNITHTGSEHPNKKKDSKHPKLSEVAPADEHLKKMFSGYGSFA